MNKTFKTQIAATVLALGFAAVAAPAAAADSLPTRAANALGFAIAAQGDAALAQIRDEIRQTVIETVTPYLPQRTDAADQAPADAEPADRQ